MEFENDVMDVTTSDTDSDISGVNGDEAVSGMGADISGEGNRSAEELDILNNADVNGDGAIFAVPFDDVIVGTNSDDLLSGTDSSDSFLSAQGDDTINGGAGDDTIDGGVGSNTLNGGPGSDLVSYDAIPSRVEINLATGVTTFAGDPNSRDILVDIENVLATPRDDVIIGNDLDNRLDGAFGLDLINGGAGNDTAVYEFTSIPIDANLATGRVTFPGQGVDNFGDTLIDIENLVGSTSDDSLTGDSGNNGLFANAGNDTLAGGAGNDTLDGSEGSDTYVFTPGAGGADIITRFENGESLDVTAFGFSDAALGGVIDSAQQIGGDALLTFDTNNTVLLSNTQVAGIDASDFIT